MSKLKADETVLGLAAAVTSRACELITDGWVKGTMRRMEGGAPVEFCIHGAVDLALEEIFGQKQRGPAVHASVEDVAVAFICDEAFGEIRKGVIPAASYNDAANRRHDEVVGVLSRAAERLWAITVDSDAPVFEFSQWANVDEAQATEYLNAKLN